MRQIIALWLAALMLAAQPLQAAVCVGFGQSAGVVYTDCSSSTADLYWYGDHADGTQYGCSGSTRITGTWDSASAVDSGTDPGTESPASGNYVAKNDSTDDRLSFPNTGGATFSASEGYFEFDIYYTGASPSAYILDATSGSDFINVTLATSRVISYARKGNSGTVATSMESTYTVPENTWTKVIVKWSVAGNYLKIKVGDNPEEIDADPDPVTAFTTEPGSFFTLKGTTTYYIDNIEIYKTPTP